MRSSLTRRPRVSFFAGLAGWAEISGAVLRRVAGRARRHDRSPCGMCGCRDTVLPLGSGAARERRAAWTQEFRRHFVRKCFQVGWMTDHITARAFHHSEGLSHWRVCAGGASAWFETPDLATGLRFALSVAALPECVDHPPDLDARSVGVMVCSEHVHARTGWTQHPRRGAARAFSEVAREHGLVADPSRIRSLVLNIGSTSPATIVAFWSAVLGPYQVDGELNDSLARQPVVCFQHVQEPRRGMGGFTSMCGCLTTMPKHGSRPRSPT